jgi:hypothetical protein
MQGTCPFAALSAMEAASSVNAIGQSPPESERIPIPYRQSRRMSTLPTIDQDKSFRGLPANFIESSMEREEDIMSMRSSRSHRPPDGSGSRGVGGSGREIYRLPAADSTVLDSNGLRLSCPMTGNFLNLEGQAPGSSFDDLGHSSGSSVAGNARRVSTLTSRPGSSFSLGPAPIQRTPSFKSSSALSKAHDGRHFMAGSVAGVSISASSVARSAQRQQVKRHGGGGVIIGQVQSRSTKHRIGKKTKPPPFLDEDVNKFAPIIKSSWGRIMDSFGYFELGGLYYDTVLSVAQDVSPLLTHSRCPNARLLSFFSSHPLPNVAIVSNHANFETACLQLA